MRWHRKYLAAYRLELSKKFVYRTNFVFGRVRELVLFAGLLYLYGALPAGVGSYDASELGTYTLLASFVFALLSGYAMNEMADEIYVGDLSNYLLRPIGYYGYWLARTLAHRSLLLFFGALELGVLVLVFGVFGGSSFVVQTDVAALGQFVLLLIGSIAIVQLLDFIAATVAVWTGRAFGPRYIVYGILIPLLSGALAPLDIFPEWFRAILAWTPFPSLAFAPLQAYLGRLDGAAFAQTLGIQAAWIAGLGIVLALMWRSATRSYEAYGR